MKNSSNMNRRSFLQRSALAGAAIAVSPMILPKRVLGINGEPGANERVSIGVIGVGNQGRYLARTLAGDSLSDRCRITAISDVYLPRGREVAESLGVAQDSVYQDYRRMLDRSDIDAVVVATPLHWHALNCIHAAQAGKDIFCEKPLTFSIVEGRRVVEAVRKYERVLQTGIQGRMHRNAHRACEYVRNGVLGKINRLIAHNYHSPMEPDFPEQEIPEGLDWDMWCGPAEKPPFNFVVWDNRSVPSWVSLRPFSGSSMTDWGSHGLDIAQWALGMDDTGPEEIWVEGEPFQPMYSTPDNPGARQEGPRSPDIFMKYPGDLVMEFSREGRWNEVNFLGENGTINITRDGFSSDPAELMGQRLENMEHTLYRGLEYTLQYGILHDWLNCIRERRDPAANVEVGHRTTSLCHLGNIARWVSGVTGETGQRLRWDSVNERFTNSEEANAFLNPYRREAYPLPETV